MGWLAPLRDGPKQLRDLRRAILSFFLPAGSLVMTTIGFDTETTGKDFYHGARPYFVTIASPDGKYECWSWRVNPETREVTIPPEDVLAIQDRLAQADRIVGQNIKFDTISSQVSGVVPDWPWDKTDCTLLMGHLLASNQPHDLTTMTLMWLGIDLQPLEDRMKQACHEARRYCRSHLPHWKIADKDMPDIPSIYKGAKSNKKGKGDEEEKPWKYDAWLPRELAFELEYPGDHPWFTVTEAYSNSDSAACLALHHAMSEEIKRRGLWEIYLCRRKLLPILHRMNVRGMTFSLDRMDYLVDQFQDESTRQRAICSGIADSVGVPDLQLAKSGMNNAMRRLLFGTRDENFREIEPALLPIPVVKVSEKTLAPSLDKECIQQLLLQLPPRSKQYAFLSSMQKTRNVDVALGFMASYRRYGRPTRGPLVSRLHCDINPCGTAHLRFSSSNPNGQNLSKKEDYNVRYCFGPEEGREWYAFDASNIERRIPAYEAGEEGIIALFERPNDPPFYGSEHLLVASLLYPREFFSCINDRGEVDGRIFKERYKATFYQWVKNGNFSIQYQAGEAKADATYHMPGAFKLIKKRFWKQEKLNNYWLSFANKNGYVETIPDREVCPERGYPILCARTERGGIKPTTPLNYHTSGTAMWWMCKAMIRVEEKLVQWRAEGCDVWSILQVHDELLLDFPKRANPKTNPKASNLWRAKEVKRLMEMGGQDIGIPTPVAIAYHPNNYKDEIGVTLSA